MTSRDTVPPNSNEVIAQYEVLPDEKGRDIASDCNEGAQETGAVAAAAASTNYLTTVLNTEARPVSTNCTNQEDQKHSSGLALVTLTRVPAKRPARSVAQITEGIAAVMASVSAGTEQRVAGEKLLRWKAEVAFAYWAKRMGHEQSLLDSQRERRLLARLRESDGNLHELLYAVDGAHRDDWIMGRDPKAPRKYDGIETVFRDRAQVERLAGLCPKWVRGELHPLAVKYQALMQPDAAAPQPQQEVAHG